MFFFQCKGSCISVIFVSLASTFLCLIGWIKFWLLCWSVDRCVVWTGDGRVFFYNPSSRTSVWERPEELAGRTDVDKMVASPPDQLGPDALSSMTGSVSTSSSGVKRDAHELDTTPAKKHKSDSSPNNKCN
jgi:hypothetical protein